MGTYTSSVGDCVTSMSAVAERPNSSTDAKIFPVGAASSCVVRKPPSSSSRLYSAHVLVLSVMPANAASSDKKSESSTSYGTSPSV